MKVFENDWVDAFRAEMEVKSGRKLFLYYVATSADFAAQRAEIQRFVELWPESIQLKFLTKLRNPRHFRETFHELAVGAYLHQCGCNTQYEKEIEGLTPDYFVQGSTQDAIVEVLTCNLSSENASYYRQVNDLSDRIAKISISANIHVQIDCEETDIDQAKNKATATAIQTWLRGNPDPQDRLDLNGIRCGILSYSSSRTTAASMISTIGGDNWIDRGPLGETI